jgi:hypothetical protein
MFISQITCLKCVLENMWQDRGEGDYDGDIVKCISMGKHGLRVKIDRRLESEAHKLCLRCEMKRRFLWWR